MLEPVDAEALLARDPRHRDCLYPYLIGEDLNNRADESPSRWVINFHDWPLERSAEGSWAQANDEHRKEWLRRGLVPADYKGPVAADFPELLSVLEERVKPERTRKNVGGKYTLRYPLYLKWWIYADKRPKLYATIQGMQRVLCFAQTSKTKYPTFAESGLVYGHKTVVIASSAYADFAVLCSHVHYSWAVEYGSSLRTDPVYTPSDCFETFPFPASLNGLDAIGERYYRHRQVIMRARQEGLTKTYNRFHDPDETAEDIATLRALHVELDQAVAAAYGWSDLDLGHGFHDTKQGLRYTLSEPARRKVLDRLLALNFERYEQELAAGLHDAKPKRAAPGKSRAKARTNRETPLQGVLF